MSASLDEIAWLYNFRGSDVPCNPVSVAYAIVTTAPYGDTQSSGAHLFIDADKLEKPVLDHLSSGGVTVHPYEEALYVNSNFIDLLKLLSDISYMIYAIDRFFNPYTSDIRQEKFGWILKP